MQAVTDILFEDDSILVVRKPAGTATESSNMRSQDMVSILKTHLVREERKKRIRSTTPPYLAMIHRLDQKVEGILVFAKTKEAAAILSKELTDGKIDKYYYAVINGVPDPGAYHLAMEEKKDGSVYIKDEIIRLPNGNAAIVSGASDAEIKETYGETIDLSKEKKQSELEYKVVAEKDGFSLLRIHLLTGRFHQIRATLRYLGVPICGDVRYGAAEGEKGAISLSSYQLSFQHPKTKERLCYTIRPQGIAFQRFEGELQ